MDSHHKSGQNTASQQEWSLQIPKVELHRHLEGALRFSTLIELAKKMGQDVPLDLAAQKKMFLVEEPMKDLATVLRKFMATQSVLETQEILTRITYEAIEDAANEGIRILELRYAPTFILQDHSLLSFEKIHSAILKGVAQAAHLPVAVGLIGIFQRTMPLVTLEKVMDFFIDTKGTWVGVDLADDEDGFPTQNFVALFSRAQMHGFPITIHAGEVDTPVSPKNVSNAIKLLGAQRIGHGLQIIHDPVVLQEVITANVTLELCPTSNWLTNGIKSLDTHPFRKLMEAGVKTTINSDDPGVFGIDLRNEYELLARSYKMTEKEFTQCNDIAAKASFIPLELKQKYWPRKI